MMHGTSSQIHETGNVPVSQHPTRSKSRNETKYGPQTAVTLIQMEPFNGSRYQGQGAGKGCGRSGIDEGCSRLNIGVGRLKGTDSRLLLDTSGCRHEQARMDSLSTHTRLYQQGHVTTKGNAGLWHRLCYRLRYGCCRHGYNVGGDMAGCYVLCNHTP